MTFKIGLIGAFGKMGKRISTNILKDPSLSIAWEIGSLSSRDALEQTDVMIDFSNPASLEENLQLAKQTSTPIVVGTTGFGEPEKKLLEKTSFEIPIFFTPNFSLGMAALVHIVESFSPLLQKNFSAQIHETHHIHKKDTPSGSALALAEAAQAAYKKSLPIESIREGEIIGEHSIIFDSGEEKITLTHTSLSRDVFALGALKAAKFLIGKKPKLYSMKDLLL